MRDDIKKRLTELSDEKYRAFSSGLLPGVEGVLGVRLPRLRKLAAELVKGDWRDYLRTADGDFFEEVMLQGMVIGVADCPPEERLTHIAAFVPKIGNWSVCDSFCTGLKFTKENPDRVWALLQPYFHSGNEFEVRFAVVMLLFYYIDEPHIDEVLRILDGVTHPGYYVKMAVAWAVSACFVRLPERTMAYLHSNTLNDFTYNKALQKITESLSVDGETKRRIRSMKRRP